MSNERLRVINADTGEDLTPSYTLTNRNQADGYKRELAKQQGRKRDFTGANMRNLHEVYDVLTTAQCGYLMLLQCYVGYDEGTLVLKGTPMTKRDMMDVLQLTRKKSTFYDFLTACLTHSIIEENDGVFAVNPRYHFKGAFGDQYVVKSYTAKIKRVYREVKAADIGLIYRMLPFVHYETNALCDNPFEQNPRLIRWFNRKELAANIGVDADTLGRRLPKMTFDGEYVVARIKVGNEAERYTFNPSVFYRKDGEPDKTLQALFSIKRR